MSIEEICKKYGISNYVINDDGSIDVDGDVDLNDCELTELPLTFNKVTGIFDCDGNNLTSLEGSPQSVGGHFYCGYNKLTSLEGSPKYVTRTFHCANNNLTDLKGSPKSIGGNFYCRNNPIVSIFNGVDIDFIRAFKTFKVLNDGVVDLKRLRYVMEIFDKPIDLKEIEKYYTIK